MGTEQRSGDEVERSAMEESSHNWRPIGAAAQESVERDEPAMKLDRGGQRRRRPSTARPVLEKRMCQSRGLAVLMATYGYVNC